MKERNIIVDHVEKVSADGRLKVTSVIYQYQEGFRPGDLEGYTFATVANKICREAAHRTEVNILRSLIVEREFGANRVRVECFLFVLRPVVDSVALFPPLFLAQNSPMSIALQEQHRFDRRFMR